MQVFCEGEDKNFKLVFLSLATFAVVMVEAEYESGENKWRL